MLARDATPSRNGKSARRRQENIQRAVELFNRQGYANTLLDNIVRAVRIKREALYYYFQYRPQILLAGGTRLAPIRAIFDDARAPGDRGPFVLFHGARNPAESYRLDELEAGAAAHRNLRVVPLPSDEPDSDWCGLCGLVTDGSTAYFGEGADPFAAEGYVSAPPPMGTTAQALLARLGTDPAEIHCDTFAPAERE